MRLKISLPNHFYSPELERLYYEEPFFGCAETVLRYEDTQCWIDVSYNVADSKAVCNIAKALMMEGYCVEMFVAKKSSRDNRNVFKTEVT